MNIEKIITLPDIRLRKKSSKVNTVATDINKLIEIMTNTALNWENSRPHEISAAISAVQIGHMQQVIIIRSDFDDKSIRNFTTLINPKIVKYEGEIIKDYEGCLSVPEVYGLVPRYNKIRVKALDANGNEIRFKSSGFLARIIQHEIDHVNGIVFIDHIRDTKDAFYKLDEEGELKPLDYEKHIRNNDVLWL